MYGIYYNYRYTLYIQTFSVHTQPLTADGGSTIDTTDIVIIIVYSYYYSVDYIIIILYTITMGPGPGLVARVVCLYCMRLASSGVGCVHRVPSVA